MKKWISLAVLLLPAIGFGQTLSITGAPTSPVTHHWNPGVGSPLSDSTGYGDVGTFPSQINLTGYNAVSVTWTAPPGEVFVVKTPPTNFGPLTLLFAVEYDGTASGTVLSSSVSFNMVNSTAPTTAFVSLLPLGAVGISLDSSTPAFAFTSVTVTGQYYSGLSSTNLNLSFQTIVTYAELEGGSTNDMIDPGPIFTLQPLSTYPAYSIDWFKVAGGGGTSTSAVYSVTGTFGQQDAGGPMQGGGFSVEGGFWSPYALQTSSVTGAAPTITTPPQSLLVSNGLPASFTVAASGDQPLFYQWQKNGINLSDGGNVSGSATSNLVVSTTSSNELGGYSVLIENAYGSVTSSVVNLTGLLPVIAVQPRSQIISNGAPAAFTVSIADSQPFSARWQKNGSNLADGGNIAGSGTTNLVLNPTSTNDAGSYDVVLQNLYGSETSSVAKLSLLLLTPLPANGFIYHGYFEIVNGNEYYNPNWAVYGSGPDAFQDLNQIGAYNNFNFNYILKWVSDKTSGQVYYGYNSVGVSDGYWYVYGSMADALQDINALSSFEGPAWLQDDDWVTDYSTGLVYHILSDASGNSGADFYNSVSNAILDLNRVGSLSTPVWNIYDKWFSDPNTGLAYHGLSDANGNYAWVVYNSVSDALQDLNRISQLPSATDWNFFDQWIPWAPAYRPPAFVNYPVELESLSVANGTISFNWIAPNTYPPVSYQVQYTTNLASGSWVNSGGVQTNTGFTNTIGPDPQRFYRVLLAQ